MKDRILNLEGNLGSYNLCPHFQKRKAWLRNMKWYVHISRWKESVLFLLSHKWIYVYIHMYVYILNICICIHFEYIWIYVFILIYTCTCIYISKYTKIFNTYLNVYIFLLTKVIHAYFNKQNIIELFDIKIEK